MNVLGVEVPNEIVLAIAGLIVALVSYGVSQYRTISRAQVQAVIEKALPDGDFQTIGVWIGMKVIDAADQLADAYEGWTSEDKQKWAADAFVKLWDLVINGKPSKLAAIALIESLLLNEKQARMSAEKVDATQAKLMGDYAIKMETVVE